MEPWQIVATVVAAHALAVASPGPDFAIVLKQAVGSGRAAALWTSLGIGRGNRPAPAGLATAGHSPAAPAQNFATSRSRFFSSQWMS